MRNYDHLTDTDLVTLLQSGDKIAYNQIYQRYKWVLYLHALRRLGNKEEAKDIIQDIFVTLWDKRHQLAIHSHLSGYLYTSVRNRVITYTAHQKVTATYFSAVKDTLETTVCITDFTVREKLLAEMIEKEINALPEKMRKVFLLSRRQHFTHKEIAEQLGIEESTVKRQVSNALIILRRKLGPLFYIISFLP